MERGDAPVEAEIQVVRLGDVILAGVPGEIFSHIGKRIKDIARPLIGMPVGYSNGYIGYIAPYGA